LTTTCSMNWCGKHLTECDSGRCREMLRDSCKPKKGISVLDSGPSRSPNSRRKCSAPRRKSGCSPLFLWFSSASWPYATIVDSQNRLQSQAALFARMDVIRMLYIHQVSNKRKQAENLFHAFVQIRITSEVRIIWALVQYSKCRRHGSQNSVRRSDRAKLVFSILLERGTQERDMRCSIANEKTAIKHFRLEKEGAKRLV